MRATDDAAPEDESPLRALSIWVAPLVVVLGVWLWSAFSAGGYLPGQWMPGALAVGLFGLVIASLIAYPRRPRQLSLAVLALFALYGLWVAASCIWAESANRVWLESARTFFYLLAMGLALVFLTDARARRAFRYLFMGALLALLIVCIVRLWSADNLAALFFDNRLVFPVSYPNNNAALFLIGFWPLMWLAAAKDERALVRGLALGLATGLFGLAIMTQSRGAIWSLGITLVLTFIVSPIRLRTLFYLIVPALLMVYSYPTLGEYWRLGPESVGGDQGARVLLVAFIASAFIGMILALLEKWVKVSRLMKTIFGAVVLLGVAAALTYGSITLTESSGGPLNWLSRAWGEFSDTRHSADSPSESEVGSRFVLTSSSGRANLWRVAWHEFTGSPVLGVGADGFVFRYDRERRYEVSKPRQAHSIVLQVLGETGIVGGMFAFSGMLLALGSLLWPRCAAGWRAARLTWLRRRTRPGPASADTLTKTRADRWGSDPTVFGWEMALLAAVAYWIVHGSVDWLWQMPGVTLPALFLLAAGVSAIDARAGVLWPRWNRWLRLSIHSSHVTPVATVSIASEGSDTSAESGYPTLKRAEVRAGKRGRRAHHGERLRAKEALLHPPGILSLSFRALLMTLSLVVLILVGLPYLSIQMQDSAIRLARSDPLRAVARAGSAHWLVLGDPAPYETQATIYGNAAQAATSTEPAQPGAVLDDLALELGSRRDAVAVEPADWALHYRAGVTALNLLLASDELAGRVPSLDYGEARPLVPGLADWSLLRGPAGTSETLPAPGTDPGSLAQTQETQEIASHYRNLTRDQLVALSLESLQEAEERNPLASQVDRAISQVRQVDGAWQAGDRPIGSW